MRILTIGIPTYNRPKYAIARLKEFKDLGYFGKKDIDIIFHDNDSEDKSHCKKIKSLSKKINNLSFIESTPNVGMIHACQKIIAQSKSRWIIFLGDDDPILQDASNLLKIIKKAKNADHILFENQMVRDGRLQSFPWWPMLKRGYYSPVKLAAKLGFVTLFAHLGAHCFRKIDNLQKIWISSHDSNMIYGHCIMAINHYERTFYPKVPLTAWTEGNERINPQVNVFRNLELRNMLKYPNSKKIRNFIKSKPLDVLEHGNFPFSHHLTHPNVAFINNFENLENGSKITLKSIHAYKLNPDHPIFFGDIKHLLKNQDYSAIFYTNNKKNIRKSITNQYCILFKVQNNAKIRTILYIITKLSLSGEIYFNKKKILKLILFFNSFRKVSNADKFSFLSAFGLIIALLFSFVLYGHEKYFMNYLTNLYVRPRKGLYKILNEIEKVNRRIIKIILGQKYHHVKHLLKIKRCKKKTLQKFY